MKRSALPRRSGPIPRQSAKRKQLAKTLANGVQYSTITGVRKPVRKRNAKRAAANLERAHGSVERRIWIKTLPCYECDAVGYSQGAHIKNGGGSRKADSKFTIPLCESRFSVLGCHNLQHMFGWSALLRLDTKAKREAAAADIARQWARTLNTGE